MIYSQKAWGEWHSSAFARSSWDGSRVALPRLHRCTILVITVFTMTTKSGGERCTELQGGLDRHEDWLDGLAEEDVWLNSHTTFSEGECSRYTNGDTGGGIPADGIQHIYCV